mgnify:CR=1 FL=1
MKIEKLRSKLKKAFNRVMGVLLPVATLFVSCGTNALVVHAAESSYTVKLHCEYDADSVQYRLKYDLIVNVPAGWELVGSLIKGADDYYEISLYMVKSNTVKQISDVVGDYYVDREQEIYRSGDITYGREKNKSSFPYKGNLKGFFENVNFTILSGNMKVFKDRDEINKYVANSSGDYDIIKPDTIDDGVKDPDIGYLHNLQMNQLQTGKQDENGIYELYSDRFTWDDTYPEYDSSYLVEVRGKCVVQTRGFLGFGKTKTYTSDIENIAKDISYKDLEWIISSQDKFAPFNSFINEHMPTNLVMTGVYGMRDLYFRIYKWSDADECYHYGPWVNMHFIDDDVWISVDGDTTLGDFDKDGNFIVNPDSDYGTGKKNDVGVGVGDTIEDAKKDNDRRNEEKKNDDGKLDLSNASISDIWYWFVTSLSNLYNSLGFIPEFFQKIFSFLPTPIYVFLGIGIVVALLLRVLGR